MGRRVFNGRRHGRPHIRLSIILLLMGLTLPFLLHPSAIPVPQRLAEAARSQVGKVSYFWGGKSHRRGPDPRWGMLSRVTSPGSDTTGALLPYGLDCSGLVSWAAVSATGRQSAYDAVGEGVRAQYANCTPVAWDKARPGDLAFFPDLSHVGIVVGRGKDGTVLVVHSSKTYGGVVLSEDAALIGFTSIGRPKFYRVYKGFTSLSG